MKHRVYASLVIALVMAGRAVSAAPSNAVALTAADKTLLAQVQIYLNAQTSLTANFLQVAADGSTRTGKAWLQRPGQMRFQYDAPDPQLLVAGSGLLVYRDPELDQTTNIPLSATPLGILLSNHVEFGGDVTVTAIDREPGEDRITLVRGSKPAAGTLTLVFGTGPLELRQWKVLDAQGRQTTVSLYDVAAAGPFPASLFQYNTGASPIQSGG